MARVDGILISRDTDMETMNVNCPEMNLYKRCGFKTADGFGFMTKWPTGRGTFIELHAKNKGKANTENKYEFPAPVDKTLFFGKCLLLQKQEDGVLVNLAIDDWNKFYDTLIGGTESIGSESDEERSVDEIDPTKKYTKEGYEVDDFVVADDELEEESYIDE
jgi:hypothetical protein